MAENNELKSKLLEWLDKQIECKQAWVSIIDEKITEDITCSCIEVQDHKTIHVDFKTWNALCEYAGTEFDSLDSSLFDVMIDKYSNKPEKLIERSFMYRDFKVFALEHIELKEG